MNSAGTINAGDAAMDKMNEPSRPWWPVGLALLGLVGALLIGGVLVARQLRPPIGVEPAPQAAPVAQPTSAAPAVPAVTAVVGAAPTSASGATSVSLPGVRVASSPLEAEVEDAYYRYLQVYADAVLNLDTSRLREVLDGGALQSVVAEVEDRKARGVPLKVIEDERLLAFGPVSDTQATLIDEYTSRSVLVDPSTKQPLPRTSPPTRVRQTYVFRKVDGVWKIVDGTREVIGER
jgi:hypothetical protein